MRQLLGVIIGLAVGLGAILGLNWLDMHFLVPNEYMPAAGFPSQAMAVGGWALGALAGGVAAVRIGDWPASGWIITLIAIGYAVLQSQMSPYPLWMQIAAVAAPFLAGVVVSGVSSPA